MRIELALLATGLITFSSPGLSAWTATSDYTFAGDWWHGAIKAKAAYDQGYFGQDVLVGVVDTGINTASREFAGRLVGCYRMSAGSAMSGCADDNGHGSHVAGIIAAAADNYGSMGIAPSARLLVYKALGSDGSGSLVDVDQAIQEAAGKGARVINASVGYSGQAWSGDKAYLQAAVNTGALLVFAAGNEGAANPSWPARYASAAWAKGQILAVGAVDGQNRIASFSNRAGDAKDFYLVAPGVDIVSTYSNAYYYYMSGTSMAAPMVTGAAALLFSYWPKLTAQQTADILLTTATDLGARGVDTVYGHGLLNVQAAMAPVGALKTAASTPTRKTTVKSSTLPSSVAPALRKRASSRALDTAALDDYGRNFHVATEALLGGSGGPSVADQLDLMFARPALAAAGKASLAYGPGADASLSGVASGAVPFLGFSSTNALYLSHELAGGMKFGLFTSLYAGAASATHGMPDAGEAGATGITLNHVAGDWTLNGGLVMENRQFMGTLNGGVMQFDNGREIFASLTRNARLGPNWSASATATLGLVGGGSGSGMVLGYSDVPVSGFSLNLAGHDLFARQDRLQLAIGQSLKAIGGTATVETASYDREQNASYSRKSVNLADGAPEYVMTLSYNVPTGKASEAGLRLQYKVNADGLEGSRGQGIVLGWTTRF